jgi:predicted alpha/beta-fold hydrolase
VSFTPARWLANPHAQTVWGRLTRPRRLVPLRREVLTTPDDDDLIVDHLDGSSIRFLLLHGLEGSTNSVYMQGLLSIIRRHGFAATAMNFRSCALDERGNPIMNRRPRLYHSGETTDFDFLQRSVPDDLPVVALGASLGGNVLLKWLGEHPGQTKIRAAATMSVPYDLGAGARHLETGWGRFYVRRFVDSLGKKAESIVRRFGPHGIDLERTRRAATFYEFDDAATAPLHGFTSAEDYWARSSSIGFIDRITTPTLCISAEDDPFLPPAVLSLVRERASKAVSLEVTTCGGHTGFIAGAPWRCEYWAEERLISWLVESVRDHHR